MRIFAPFCAALFVCVAITFSGADAKANDTSWLGGTVQNIVCVNGSSSCAFTLSGTRTGMPSCANSDTSYAFVSNTAAGDAVFKMLLAAKAAGWHINAYGRNACTTTYGNGYQEDLDYVQLTN